MIIQFEDGSQTRVNLNDIESYKTVLADGERLVIIPEKGEDIQITRRKLQQEQPKVIYVVREEEPIYRNRNIIIVR